MLPATALTPLPSTIPRAKPPHAALLPALLLRLLVLRSPADLVWCVCAAEFARGAEEGLRRAPVEMLRPVWLFMVVLLVGRLAVLLIAVQDETVLMPCLLIDAVQEGQC